MTEEPQAHETSIRAGWGSSKAAFLWVMFMLVVLGIYLFFVGREAIALLSSGELVGVVMGAAFIVIPLLAMYGVLADIRFGANANRLGRILDAEGGLPDVEVPLMPSGRPDKEAALAVFDQFQQEAETDSDNWRTWFRLGLAYDAAGDRRRGRTAIREAIRLERESRRSLTLS